MPSRANCLGALAAAIGGVILLAGSTARADRHPGTAGPAHGRAAQRIVLDPATHLPIAGEAAEVASVASGRRMLPAEPEEVHLPDGTVGVKVAQQYFHTIVVCRQRDGSFSTQCPVARTGALP